MAHAYSNISAKPVFAKFNKSLSSSEVTANRRINNIYCNCKQSNVNLFNTQSKLIELNKIKDNNCRDGCNIFPYNKSNMEINLFTQLDLSGVIIVSSVNDVYKPSKINPSLTPVYAYYNFDPNNSLTGNTPCSVKNYLNYMVLKNGINTSGNKTPQTTKCYC